MQMLIVINLDYYRTTTIVLHVSSHFRQDFANKILRPALGNKRKDIIGGSTTTATYWFLYALSLGVVSIEQLVM